MRGAERYGVRVQRVIDYMTEHMDENLDLETIAQIAHFSPYHFHRIYRGLLGETLNDTVRRLRLQRSAIELLEGQLTIDRIAHRAGYSTQAAFTRAFREEYGEPPARYRLGQHIAQLDHPASLDRYCVESVALPRIRVAAIQHRGDYQLTSRAFERLMTIAATSGLLRPTTRTFGMFHDDPAAVAVHELRSTACISVPETWTPSNELTEAHVEGGRYAKVTYIGPYAELKTAYDWLYQTWLPQSDEEPRNLPCVEEYLNDARQVSARDLKTAIMLPLEG